MVSNILIGCKPERKIKDLKLKIGRNPVYRSGTVIYQGSKVGDGLRTGHHAIIREENKIGNNFCLWSNSIVDYGCKIGNNVKIHCNCYIAQFTTIEDDVFIGPGTVTCNDLHPGCKKSRECLRGPVIKRGARIGANVTILPYVKIGQNSLIGAGSVVTKDIPADLVACGNPARVVRKVNEVKCKKGLLEKYYR